MYYYLFSHSSQTYSGLFAKYGSVIIVCLTLITMSMFGMSVDAKLFDNPDAAECCLYHAMGLLHCFEKKSLSSSSVDRFTSIVFLCYKNYIFQDDVYIIPAHVYVVYVLIFFIEIKEYSIDSFAIIKTWK